jgi:LmbE family N-acetylglucosaminyl deacetylase
MTYMPTPIDEVMLRLCAGPDGPRVPPRTLVVAAHPGDETIGLAGRLPWLNRWATILHVADGPPVDAGDAPDARRELELATALAGIAALQLETWHGPAGTAWSRLVPLARRLADVIRQRRPELVVSHPYEGGHPDRDATAFAVHAACRLVGAAAPPLVEMASDRIGPGDLGPGTFLPVHLPITAVTLSPTDRDLKRRMLDCFARLALADLPVEVERFRPAPAYHFGRPPHAGQLFYERSDPGMDGARFCSLARNAAFTLGV